MRAVTRLAPCTVALLSLLGCSVVNDPSRHQEHPPGSFDAGSSSSDGGSPDGGVAPIDPEDACNVLANAYCDAYMRCCTMRTLSDGECRSTALMRCEMSIRPYLVNMVTGYDRELAGEIIAEGIELMSTCETEIAEWYTYDLLTVLRGTRDRGVTCITPGEAFAGQFAGVFSCNRDTSLVCRPPGGALMAWTCQGVSNEMGPCNYIGHCARGLYCTGSLIFNGQCLPQRVDGMPCKTSEQCQSLNCVMGTCEEVDESVYCVDPLPTVGDMPMPAG